HVTGVQTCALPICTCRCARRRPTRPGSSTFRSSTTSPPRASRSRTATRSRPPRPASASTGTGRRSSAAPSPATTSGSEAMRGIWPILFAYFDEGDRLDRTAMRRQVECAIAWGAPGVAVLGVATEVGKLSVDERRTVIRWAAEDIAGRAPLAVTIAGETVAAQRALAEY